MRTARDRQGGFVLVEAIAVLLLSGLVMLTLLIATDLVTRNSSAAARRANAVEGLSTGLAALRRDIAAASFIRAGPEPRSPILFNGGPRSLSLAIAGEASGAPAASLVRIESRYEGGRGLLVRSDAPLGLSGGGFAGAAFGNAVILLEGPWTYRLAYGAAGGGAMVWQDSWSGRPKLPEAVRVEILDAASSRRVLPPVVAALKVDAEIRCEPSEGGGCGGAGDSGNEPLDEEALGGGETDDTPQ
jgi:hypothetical protein